MFPYGHIPRIIPGLADLRPERVRVPLEAVLDRPLPVLLVLDVVEAVHAVAQVAELAVREAVAVQLQALRLGAVARLARAHAVRLRAGIGGRRGGFFDGGRRRPHGDRHFGVLGGDEGGGHDDHLGGRGAGYLH